MANDEESVDYQIRIDTINALKSLESLTETAASVPEIISAVESEIQKMADRFGVSFETMKVEFKDTIASAHRLREALDELQMPAFNVPTLDLAASVKSPFGEIGDPAGFKAVTDMHRESLMLSKQEQQSAAAVAKEINTQAAAEEKVNQERLKNLELANQELLAVEKEGEALAAQLKNYGQISRTASETMNYLRSFAGTQQGQGILSSFFGDYKQAGTIKAQIDTIKGAIGDLSKATGASFSQSGQLIKEQFSEIPGIVNQTNQAVNQMGRSFEDASTKSVRGVDAVRIALGALVAMLVFNVIQAFQQAFSTAIKNATELEASLYRLHNAERILSNEGINVSTKGLEDGIKRIKALLPIFSKEDITGLVGQVAITTKSLGLTEKQIVDLSQSIAVLNVNSAENEDLQATAQKVISSLLTSNAKGVANLGIKLGDSAIQAEAMSMGLLKAGESASDLTEHEKGLVKVAIAIQTGSDSVKGLNEYLDSNTAKIQKNKAAWNDMLTTLGQLLLPFLPTITALFNAINDGLNGIKAALVVVLTLLNSFVGVWLLFEKGGIKSLKNLTDALHYFGEELKKTFSKQFFPEGLPDNAPKWLKDWLGKSAPQATETPTASIGTSSAEIDANNNKAKMVAEAESKIQDIMQESADKKADIEMEYGRKLEDIARDYSNKLQDIARETAQKREDALRDYNQKVEDINRKADEDIQKAKEDARRQDIDREKKYQEQLRELKEKFLFDLQDALENRDARQVLHLIRQYNMDKKNLEERHKLERQQAKRDLAEKLADIEKERQLKLQAAQREYQEKLQEIAIGEARALQEAKIWQQRQLADANLWHQRQLQEYRQYLQRKLRDLAEALVKEYQLTAAGAAAIYSLLNSYFGSGGAIQGLLANSLTASMNGILNTTSTLGGTGGSGGSTGSGAFPSFSSTFNTVTSGMGYAEGGTLIATHPTTAMFGEKGPERIDITPLNGVGNNVGKVFGDKSAMGGMGGEVKISLELSPDLEAKIVESSLDNLSVHIDRVSRSKA